MMTDQTNQLDALYHSIDQNGRQRLRNHQVDGDPVLASHHADQRRGLTLIATLPAHVQRNIQYCLAAVQPSVPDLYCYPSANLHITIIDLLRARPGFTLSPAQFDHYRELVSDVLSRAQPVEWTLKGVYISPAGILVGGYYSPNLTVIRDQIRQACQYAGLPIEERYQTTSGHITVARFVTPPADAQQVITAVDALADLNFGAFTSHNFSLVVHDWYNSQIDQAATLSIGAGA